MTIPSHLLHQPKFQKWKQRIESAECTLHSVSELHSVYKDNNELLFGLYRCDVRDPQGTPLLPIVLIRGDAVVIVVRLEFDNTFRYLMVRQRRVGSGLDSLEFPAGMLDTQVDDPLSVAVSELQEETGLQIDGSTLKPLFDRELYSSVGLSDEAIHYYGVVVNLSRAQAESFEGRLMGQKDEGEQTRVCLCDRNSILTQASSLQTILGLYLFENLTRMKSLKAA